MDETTRLEPRAQWGDLVLPEPQLTNLREIVRSVRHRNVVEREWGFGTRTDRGLGVTALFSGQPGRVRHGRTTHPRAAGNMVKVVGPSGRPCAAHDEVDVCNPYTYS